MKQIILNADAHGLGDLCVTSFISEGSKDKSVRLIHFATGDNKRVLQMLGQEISYEKPKAITANKAYEMELKEKGSISRVLSRSYELGIYSEPKHPVAVLPQTAINYAKIQQNNNKNPLILLFPEVEWVPREWPASYWVDLAWMLHQSNYDVRIFTKRENPKFSNTPRFFYEQDIINVAALMKEASVVVGNDSGPVNLSGTLNVPTLALCGPTTSSCFSHLPTVEVLASTYHCTGCYFGEPFRPACDQGCKSLFMLDAKTVMKKIQKMLKPKSFFKQLFM